MLALRTDLNECVRARSRRGSIEQLPGDKIVGANLRIVAEHCHSTCGKDRRHEARELDACVLGVMELVPDFPALRIHNVEVVTSISEPKPAIGREADAVEVAVKKI